MLSPVRVGARWALPVLVALAAGCQQPAPPPTPAASPARPSPAASPGASMAPVPVGATRLQVLSAANAAFQQGNLAAALELYERVINTPPGPGEEPAVSAAIEGLARFRAMVALAAAGREPEARQQLTALQQHDPSGPFTRLAAQFWDQYGMTAQVRPACAQLRADAASQAGPVLETLRELGAGVDPDALCSVPGGAGA